MKRTENRKPCAALMKAPIAVLALLLGANAVLAAPVPEEPYLAARDRRQGKSAAGS